MSRRHRTSTAPQAPETGERPGGGARAAGRGNSALQDRVAADVSFDELDGRTATEKFQSLDGKGTQTVFLPSGRYEVEAPLVFEDRVFLFGDESDKPVVKFQAPRGVKKATGMTFASGARIRGVDFRGGRGVDTLLQFGTTRTDPKCPNEDDTDSGVSASSFSGFDTAIRYNGRNCKVNDSDFDSRRAGSTDVHLSYDNIEVDHDGQRGTLPHYSHRKNSFRGNRFTAGGDRTGVHLSGEVPVRGVLLSGNEKQEGGSLLKASGRGGVRDGVLHGNRVTGIGKDGDPTVHLDGTSAHGLVMHGNHFEGLRKGSELVRSGASRLKGNGSAAGKGLDRVHGMSFTGNRLEYAAALQDSLPEAVRARVEGDRVLGEDMAWSGNAVGPEESGPALGGVEDPAEERADFTIRSRPTDKTELFKTIAEDKPEVVFIAPGKHVVKEPIVFTHRLKLMGPKAAGGTKSSRPKVLFDFSELIARKELDATTLTGFTFEAGADLERVTFKGGLDKGDDQTTVNLLQFGKAPKRDGSVDNTGVSASVRSCNLGEFKGKTAITNYGTESLFERLSFSDSPGKGTTGIELHSAGEAAKKGDHRIRRNTFHLGPNHTSVRVSGDRATKNLQVEDNVSDLGGRFLHVDGDGGLKRAQIHANTVQGGQRGAHPAIVDFESGRLSDVSLEGNSFTGLDLRHAYAEDSEDKLTKHPYASNPYREEDRPGHILRVAKEARVQPGGLDVRGNNLSFARHGQEAVSVAGKRNRRGVSVAANVIRNSAKRKGANKTGDGGVTPGVAVQGNVGSGRKKDGRR